MTAASRRAAAFWLLPRSPSPACRNPAGRLAGGRSHPTASGPRRGPPARRRGSWASPSQRGRVRLRSLERPGDRREEHPAGCVSHDARHSFDPWMGNANCSMRIVAPRRISSSAMRRTASMASASSPEEGFTRVRSAAGGRFRVRIALPSPEGPARGSMRDLPEPLHLEGRLGSRRALARGVGSPLVPRRGRRTRCPSGWRSSTLPLRPRHRPEGAYSSPGEDGGRLGGFRGKTCWTLPPGRD